MDDGDDLWGKVLEERLNVVLETAKGIIANLFHEWLPIHDLFAIGGCCCSTALSRGHWVGFYIAERGCIQSYLDLE
jgi:hypothetical protein